LRQFIQPYNNINNTTKGGELLPLIAAQQVEMRYAAICSTALLTRK